jgi:hypothetical protein
MSKKIKASKIIKKPKKANKVEHDSSVHISNDTVRYMYDSMVRIEKKVDCLVVNGSTKVSRKEAYLAGGAMSGIALFLSLVINGHILPQDIPAWIKAAVFHN